MMPPTPLLPMPPPPPAAGAAATGGRATPGDGCTKPAPVDGTDTISVPRGALTMLAASSRNMAVWSEMMYPPVLESPLPAPAVAFSAAPMEVISAVCASRCAQYARTGADEASMVDWDGAGTVISTSTCRAVICRPRAPAAATPTTDDAAASPPPVSIAAAAAASRRPLRGVGDGRGVAHP